MAKGSGNTRSSNNPVKDKINNIAQGDMTFKDKVESLNKILGSVQEGTVITLDAEGKTQTYTRVKPVFGKGEWRHQNEYLDKIVPTWAFSGSIINYKEKVIKVK